MALDYGINSCQDQPHPSLRISRPDLTLLVVSAHAVIFSNADQRTIGPLDLSDCLMELGPVLRVQTGHLGVSLLPLRRCLKEEQIAVEHEALFLLKASTIALTMCPRERQALSLLHYYVVQLLRRR